MSSFIFHCVSFVQSSFRLGNAARCPGFYCACYFARLNVEPCAVLLYASLSAAAGASCLCPCCDRYFYGMAVVTMVVFRALLFC